jgi:hypothetical protein
VLCASDMGAGSGFSYRGDWCATSFRWRVVSSATPAKVRVVEQYCSATLGLRVSVEH